MTQTLKDLRRSLNAFAKACDWRSHIPTKELLQILSSLIKIIPNKPTHVVTSCFSFHAEGSWMTIRAFNLSTYIESKVYIGGNHPYSRILIPASIIYELVRAIEKTIDKVILTIKDNFLEIEFSDAIYKLRGVDTDWIDSIPKDTIIATIKVDKSFLAKIKPLVVCVSSDTTKQVLTGIHLSQEKDNLRMEACDGYSLAIDWIPASIDGNLDAIISQEFIDVISKLDLTEDLTLEIYPDSCQLYADGVRVFSRLVEGKYPDIKRLAIAPSDFIEINPRELIKQVRACKEGNECVWLAASKDSLVVEGDRGSGKIAAKVPSTIDITKVYAKFDPNWLIPLLQKLGDKASISISPNKLGVFKPSGSSAYFGLMPSLLERLLETSPIIDGVVVRSVRWKDKNGNTIAYEKAESLQYIKEDNCLKVIADRGSAYEQNVWRSPKDLPYEYNNGCLTVVTELHETYWEKISPALPRQSMVKADFLVAMPLPKLLTEELQNLQKALTSLATQSIKLREINKQGES